jgi:CysZ protein
MIRALTLSLDQLSDGRFLRVVGLGTALTLILAVLLAIGAGWGLHAVFGGLSSLGLPGWLRTGIDWIDGAAAALGGLAVLAGFLFLFPALATAVMGLFLDDIVDAVEARHYSDAKAPRPTGLIEGARLGLMSGLRLLLVNMLLSPLYLLLLFTGIGSFLLYFLVNGWLLGRDMSQMVVVRHLQDSGERQWRQRNRRTVFLFGALLSGLYLLPFINLLAPVIGAAMATHLYHLNRT